jgi:hypothetical protein
MTDNQVRPPIGGPRPQEEAMQLSLFNELDVPVIHMSRRDDPPTSKGAAQIVKTNAKTQRFQLLKAYFDHRLFSALTDDQAAEFCGLRTIISNSWWKRCSELRNLGLIKQVGTAISPFTGVERMTCEITNEGIILIEKMKDY